MQMLIVALVVLGAAMFVGSRVLRTVRAARASGGKGKGKNCGSGCGCSH